MVLRATSTTGQTGVHTVANPRSVEIRFAVTFYLLCGTVNKREAVQTKFYNC